METAFDERAGGRSGSSVFSNAVSGGESPHQTHGVAITLKPSQGLKPHFQVLGDQLDIVAITLKPSQGLKQPAIQGIYRNRKSRSPSNPLRD